ncbi:hypothetical protein D3C73_1088910 [compost metagenome]
MSELPGADVAGDPLAQEEVHPDAVGVGLVGAVGQENAVEVLQGQSSAQLQGHAFNDLFHVLLHPESVPTAGDT